MRENTKLKKISFKNKSICQKTLINRCFIKKNFNLISVYIKREREIEFLKHSLQYLKNISKQGRKYIRAFRSK